MTLTFQSRKLKRVVKNTLTVVTLHLQEVIELSLLIEYMFSEILKIKLNSQTLPIKCITDSKSLHDAVY